MKTRFANPYILVFILLCCLPLTLGLGYSLAYSLGLTGYLNNGFTTEHWKAVIGSSEVWSSITYTFFLSIVSLVLSISIAVLIAYQHFKNAFSRIWQIVIGLPLLFSPLMAAFAWYYLLNQGGLLSRMSFKLGLVQQVDSFPRLVNDNLSIGILIAQIFLVAPIFCLLFMFQTDKVEFKKMAQSAWSLGATKTQFVRRFFVPAILFQHKSLFWLYGIFLMGVYEVALVLGQNQPRVVTLFITDKMTKFNLNDIPIGHTMASLYSILLLTVTAIFIFAPKNRIV